MLLQQKLASGGLFGNSLDVGLLGPSIQQQQQQQGLGLMGSLNGHLSGMGGLGNSLTLGGLGSSLSNSLGNSLNLGLGSVSTSSGNQQQGELHSLVHEFEFANLEFMKPTRMNKVYVAFSCTVLDLDMLFCVFNVPTIGICRAEQREKACQRLGINMALLDGSLLGAPPVKQEPCLMETAGPTRKRDAGVQVRATFT